MTDQMFPVMGAQFLKHVTSNPSKFATIKQKCNGQKSLKEIFSCIWDEAEAYTCLTPTFLTSDKSDSEADRLRTEGNGYFRKKNFEKALELYNLSIKAAAHPVLREDATLHVEPTNDDDCYVFSPVNPTRYGGVGKGESEALAKSFANRSAILLELGFYDTCLRDINLALEYGYPEELHAKLQERKQKCLAAQSGLANKKHSTLNTESLRELSLALKRSATLGESPSLQKLLSITALTAPKIDDRNKAVPSLSSAVKVSFTPSQGRGLVAVRDILPGEVLLVDRAFNISLEEDKLSIYCSTCLSFCLTPLPCPGCSKVIFCSEVCRIKGLTEEHWLECRILPTVMALKIPATLHPFKLLKSASHGQLNVMLNKLDKEEYDHPENLGRSRKGVYNSESYQTIHHLCTNKEQLSSLDLMKHALYAALFTKLLQQSGRYFVNDDGDSITPTREDIVTTGSVMLSHILLMHCNEHSLMDVQQFKKRIGSGIFPTTSLMNHSCNPSVHRYMCGRESVIRAMRPIKAGEEIFDAYANDYSIWALPQRLAHLKQYCFNCCCEACKCKWPTYDYLPKFKCIECKQGNCEFVDVCMKCRFNHMGSNTKSRMALLERKWDDIAKPVHEAIERVRVIDGMLKSGNCIPKKVMKDLCKSVELVHKYVPMPCQSICYIEDILEISFRKEV